MEYTHLTAYSEQPEEIFGEFSVAVTSAVESVYSEPLNKSASNDQIDPYASQQVYDAYSSQLDAESAINIADSEKMQMDAIKDALVGTYASADPYFEATLEENREGNVGDDSSESDEESKQAPIPRSLSSYAVKDWNEEFQRLLQEEDNYEKFVNLGQLAQEFVYTAQTYGRVIISELSVPLANKTIKPVSIGGAAGGEKYLVNGILFKFALDFNNIYGGDENAAKAAGHDLKGSIQFFLARSEGLHMPLMALINYMGFCLVAMSVLPISSSTLKYGSSDSGMIVHVDDDVLFDKMTSTAQSLNLKGHFVGATKQSMRFLYGPGDLEGHLGQDGRYYVIDFARLFPPEAPIEENNAKEKGRILYKLLRPELVALNSVPLSSDAFTGWSVLDKKSCQDNNSEVLECTKRLLFVVIPQFAEQLKNRVTDISSAFDTNITSELHTNGINVRYLGHIRRLITEGVWRKTLLSMIIARTVASIIKKKWRKTIATSKYITEQKCKEIAVHIINNTFVSTAPEYQSFVQGKLRQQINKKFKYSFFEEEEAEGFDYVEECFNDANTGRVTCARKITAQLGIELSPMAENFLKWGIPLVRRDIVAIHPRVKHMNVIDIAEAQEMLYSALNGDGAHTQFEHVSEYFKRTIQEAPHIVKYQLEFILRSVKSYRKRLRTIEWQPSHEASLMSLSRIMSLISEVEQDDRLKHEILLEREKLHLTALQLSDGGAAKNIGDRNNTVTTGAIQAIMSLKPHDYRPFRIFLEMAINLQTEKKFLVQASLLERLFASLKEPLKDEPHFQLQSIKYLLYKLACLGTDTSQEIIGAIKGIEKPAVCLPKLMQANKLAFLKYKHCGYEHFKKILGIAKEVPLLAQVLQELVAKTRQLHVTDLCSPDCYELLQRLVPEKGFVSLKAHKHAYSESLLYSYLKASPELTNLDMDEYPDLSEEFIRSMETCPNITKLSLSRVGPKDIAFSTLKRFAPNLEMLAINHVDLTLDQITEILLSLPETLTKLGLSSPNITDELFSRQELLPLLNRLVSLDLSNCTGITVDTVAQLVALPNLEYLNLKGCTGIHEQEFYHTVYKVPSHSLLTLISMHGYPLQYMNSKRSIQLQPSSLGGSNITIKDADVNVIEKYEFKTKGFGSYVFCGPDNFEVEASKRGMEKILSIDKRPFAVIKPQQTAIVISVGGKAAATIFLTGQQTVINLFGCAFHKLGHGTSTRFAEGACFTLIVPIYLMACHVNL